VIYVGDCLDMLNALEDDSIDAMITDPPAGIAFMGKDWDKNKGGRDEWIAWLTERLEEAYRVLKPGAHILVWSLPRTSHWTGTAIEDAGFDIRDRLGHFFGTGFPKSANISKQIDKAAGAKRKVVGKNPNHRAESGVNYEGTYAGGNTGAKDITAAETDAAKRWEGWATALKPACEDWWLARKPFKGAAYKNVLKHGTGALNIDSARIGMGGQSGGAKMSSSGHTLNAFGGYEGGGRQYATEGRWPAHIAFSHNHDCKPDGIKVEKGHKGYPKGPGGKSVHWSPDSKRSDECRTEAWTGHADKEVQAWACTEGCPVAELDAQSGVLTSGERKAETPNGEIGYHKGGSQTANGTHYKSDAGGASRFFYTSHPGCTEGCPVAELDAQSLAGGTHSAGHSRSGSASPQDQTSEGAVFSKNNAGSITNNRGTERMHRFGDVGGASRFFYCAKPAKKEKNAGLDEPNPHPTVKSAKLMSWLINLITPPGGTVLDPFTGSGSTGVACATDGFEFIGIEQSEEYAEIAEKRIEYARKQKLVAEVREEQKKRNE
jgi:site-specific DNA-methyltransferase (adenine-specific)